MTMMTNERRDLILRELTLTGSLNVTEFAERIGASGMTIRRDLAALELKGELQRVHGGAIAVPVPKPTPIRQSRGVGAHLRGINDAQTFHHAGGRGVRGTVPTLGLVVPSARYYFQSVIRGAESAARDHGARLVLAVSGYSAVEEDRQVERLLASGVDGLIVTFSRPSLAQSPALDLLGSTTIPIVIAERPIDDVRDDLRLESVRSDHARGAEIAVNHLINLGHTRIALCARSNSPTTTGVIKGYRQALAHAGLDWSEGNEYYFGTKDQDPDEYGRDMEDAADWAIAGKYTAVLLLNDQDALTFVDNCHARGLSIPNDLAIVAYDDEVAALGAVPLSAIAPPKYDVGYQAVQMCLDRLSSSTGRPLALRQVSLSPELVIRESSEPL